MVAGNRSPSRLAAVVIFSVIVSTCYSEFIGKTRNIFCHSIDLAAPNQIFQLLYFKA